MRGGFNDRCYVLALVPEPAGSEQERFFALQLEASSTPPVRNDSIPLVPNIYSIMFTNRPKHCLRRRGDRADRLQRALNFVAVLVPRGRKRLMLHCGPPRGNTRVRGENHRRLPGQCTMS